MRANTTDLFVDKQSQENSKQGISYDYIRGLVDGEGCFTFCSTKDKNGNKQLIPSFVISMSIRDEDLLHLVVNKLNLKSKINVYKPRYRKDGYKRQGMAILMVRKIGYIKNIIVPLFYKKLHGYKGKQFEEWLEKIGNNKEVPERYKLIYKLYKWGFYEKNSEKFD